MKFDRNLWSAFTLFAASLLSLPGFAEDHANINESGFSAVIDDDLFSQGLTLQNTRAVGSKRDENSLVQSNLEVESINSNFADSPDDTLESLASDYQSQGLKIKRFSTSWQSQAGSLTVGNDWANFQDILGADKKEEGIGGSDNRTVVSQIKWLSPNGFSIALEDSPSTSVYPTDGAFFENLFNGSPSIILSWQGGAGEKGGYRVTAMGKKLDSGSRGQHFDGRDVMGWGLDLEGGWQIGDLFAALSVTFGKGIDSYVLQKFGDDILVTPNDYSPAGESFGIRPSLHYSLNDKSDFHVALGHYSSLDTDNHSGIDTLDTIHMGYSWSPWPSTKIGLELVGKNLDGRDGKIDDAQVTLGAEKRF